MPHTSHCTDFLDVRDALNMLEDLLLWHYDSWLRLTTGIPKLHFVPDPFMKSGNWSFISSLYRSNLFLNDFQLGNDLFRLRETLGTGGWFGMVRTAGGSPAGAKTSPRLPFKRLRKNIEKQSITNQNGWFYLQIHTDSSMSLSLGGKFSCERCWTWNDLP